MLKIFLLFTIVPLLELWLIIEIGRLIGTGPTILLLFLTGFLGYFLVNSQGLALLYSVQNDLANDVIPTGKILDGLCILFGGAFLLTPGLITDVFGFALLVPASRFFIKKLILKIIIKLIEKGSFHVWRR